MTKRFNQKKNTDHVKELNEKSSNENCIQIEVSRIHPFEGHPYKVKDDDKMHELVESILTDGVKTPVIVRPMDDGDYQMISGHRRLFAVNQIGLEKIPAIVKIYSDDEAIMALIDSNLYRDDILISEKAFAFKMRYEAMRRLDKQNISTSSRKGKKLWADIQLAEDMGESRNNIHRYMRLTELIPSILNLVDKKALAIVTAVEISYLDQKTQKMLYEYMLENGICKAFQLYAVRDYLKTHETITRMELIRILNENAPRDESNRFQKITIAKTKLMEYFPIFYTKSQIENVIFNLLEDWKRKNAEKES